MKSQKSRTVAEAVVLVERTGAVCIEPLRYRVNPYKAACFAAAAAGLIRKVRENCGRFHFYPLNKD